MLDAAFRLARMESNDYDLARAIATVTAIPARCAALNDRGSIAVGKRADLVLVSECGQQPLIETVWSAGRYITRRPESGGENHMSLPEAEFRKRQAMGLFAMDWQANGYLYGIGNEIDLWLARGHHVLINGSRSYLGQAQERYGSTLVPVLISVTPEKLRQRLIQRGRESVEEIDARVRRASQFAYAIPMGTAVVDNNGTLEEAFDQLQDLITMVQESVVAHGF